MARRHTHTTAPAAQWHVDTRAQRHSCQFSTIVREYVRELNVSLNYVNKLLFTALCLDGKPWTREAKICRALSRISKTSSSASGQRSPVGHFTSVKIVSRRSWTLEGRKIGLKSCRRRCFSSSGSERRRLGRRFRGAKRRLGKKNPFSRFLGHLISLLVTARRVRTLHPTLRRQRLQRVARVGPTVVHHGFVSSGESHAQHERHAASIRPAKCRNLIAETTPKRGGQ